MWDLKEISLMRVVPNKQTIPPNMLMSPTHQGNMCNLTTTNEGNILVIVVMGIENILVIEISPVEIIHMTEKMIKIIDDQILVAEKVHHVIEAAIVVIVSGGVVEVIKTVSLVVTDATEAWIVVV